MPCVSQTREPAPRSGTKDAGAKTGTMTSSKVWRVTFWSFMLGPRVWFTLTVLSLGDSGRGVLRGSDGFFFYVCDAGGLGGGFVCDAGGVLSLFACICGVVVGAAQGLSVWFAFALASA
ncbi:membrane hypothetical protein [Paraburkholderia caribensis]|nr:membrane hypothetical protein [Paraburkholderia caribensis]